MSLSHIYFRDIYCSPYCVNNEDLPNEVQEAWNHPISLTPKIKESMQEMVCFFILGMIMWQKIKDIIRRECPGCQVNADDQLTHFCIYLTTREYLFDCGWFERYFDWNYQEAFKNINWRYASELFKVHSNLYDEQAEKLCDARHWRTRKKGVMLREYAKFYVRMHASNDNSYHSFLSHLWSINFLHGITPNVSN